MATAFKADDTGPGAGATLADVAARAGVGESTVSRVLRGKGSFSNKSREKVLTAAGALGYVPNRIAGSLASAGSRLVAMIVPSITNIVFADVLSGAGSVLEEAGYQAVFAVTGYDSAREEDLIASMLAWRPAAILVAGCDHSPRSAQMLRASGCRIVELLDTDGEGIDLVVGFSNRAAGRAGARHLIRRGYRRIGYVGHDLALDRRAARRLEGFEAELAEAGLGLAGVERAAAPSSVEAGSAGLARLLADRPGLDAVYFSNDDMAMGGYFHCLAHAIAVPRDLALFGHNGLDMGRASPQPLTTIRTPRAEVGRVAARLALSDEPAQRVDLGFELIIGATA